MNLIDYNFKLNAIIKDGYLTTNEIALMFVIINLQNTLRMDMFGLPTRTTSAHLNLSMPTYYRTLEGLESKGLVQIIEQGKKNQAPIIRIIFDKKFLSNQCNIEESFSHSIKENEQMLLKNFSESVNINKKEERIKNKDLNNNSNSKMEKFEHWKPSDCKDYLQERIEQHKEQLQMSLSISEEKINRSLEYFISHYDLQNTIYNFKSESWKHFINWLKSYDIDKPLKQPTKKIIFEKKSQRFETFEQLKNKVNGNT